MKKSTSYSQHRNFCNCKLVFLTLLIVNSLIGSLFWIHEGNRPNKDEKILTNMTREQITLLERQLTNSTSDTIRSIRQILESEYNHQDLIRFYYLVQLEYSLGLKCLRANQTSQNHGKIIDTLLKPASVRYEKRNEYFSFRLCWMSKQES